MSIKLSVGRAKRIIVWRLGHLDPVLPPNSTFDLLRDFSRRLQAASIF